METDQRERLGREIRNRDQREIGKRDSDRLEIEIEERSAL
jgi:hypothetical protein